MSKPARHFLVMSWNEDGTPKDRREVTETNARLLWERAGINCEREIVSC